MAISWLQHRTSLLQIWIWNKWIKVIIVLLKGYHEWGKLISCPDWQHFFSLKFIFKQTLFLVLHLTDSRCLSLKKQKQLKILLKLHHLFIWFILRHEAAEMYTKQTCKVLFLVLNGITCMLTDFSPLTFHLYSHLGSTFWHSLTDTDTVCVDTNVMTETCLCQAVWTCYSWYCCCWLSDCIAQCYDCVEREVCGCFQPVPVL